MQCVINVATQQRGVCGLPPTQQKKGSSLLVAHRHSSLVTVETSGGAEPHHLRQTKQPQCSGLQALADLVVMTETRTPSKAPFIISKLLRGAAEVRLSVVVAGLCRLDERLTDRRHYLSRLTTTNSTHHD